MAADRKTSNLKMACQRAYPGHPLAPRVPTLTLPTINDHRAASDFLPCSCLKKGG